MSLVAYGASDDSESSDVEESEKPQATGSRDTDGDDPALTADGKISDDDDYVPTARIHTPISGPSSAVSSTREGGINSFYAPSTMRDLPAPKPRSPTAEGGGQGEDELEEEVKPKAAQLADAPKPPPRKAKQPARIVLPALKKDSDDEEEESQKKTKQPTAAAEASGSGSGLFALLPPPMHSSKKQANRPLIPYTLTKKPATPKTTPKPSPTSTTSDPDRLPSQKHQSAFNALTGYESDSDEEEGGGGVVSNFFSMGSNAEGASTAGLSVVKNSAPSVQHVVESSDKTAGGKVCAGATGDLTTRVPSVSSSRSHPTPSPARTALESPSPVSSSSSSLLSTVSAAASTSRDSSSSVAAEKSADGGDDKNDDDDGDDDDDNGVSSTSAGLPVMNPNAPLSFSSALQQSGRSWMTAPLTSPMLPEMYATPVNTGAATYWQQQQHYAQDYSGMAEEEQVASSSSGQDIHQYMQDEEFQRISGKRKRGGQEDIQIIDANVDDYVDPSELMKGISEESAYQPHRKKDNLPSSQQRRKKQITYLAFQAKERELELKNQWSQNRMTKNQSRSKYGF